MMFFPKKTCLHLHDAPSLPAECAPLLATLEQVRSAGYQRVALAYFETSPLRSEWQSFLRTLNLAGIIRCDGQPDLMGDRLGLKTLDLKQTTPNDVDCIIVFDRVKFDWALRYLEVPILKGIVVTLAHLDSAIAAPLRNTTKQEALSWIPTEYVARSGLTGHYLEFGVYWGRSFFSNYFRFKEWLEGDFYAFDSFAGLSQPLPQETEYTGGDFRQNTYAFNLPSFKLLSQRLEIEKDRIQLVPGFYEESLRRAPSHSGLTDNSVSVCVIDCDLREPTAHVLDFVAPLLQKGALLYFDDWRLCRASAEVGERAAAVRWLAQHPEFELIELHRDHWQHQWFIFQKS